MKFTYHTLTEHPEVGKKVAIVELSGYLYIDRCFAIWNGEKWDFARSICDYKDTPTPEDRLYWRDVLSGKMTLRGTHLLWDTKDCKHIWGEGSWGDENGVYYEQSTMRKDMDSHVDMVYRYCPICGKKLVLSESENEVELIEEAL